MESSHRTKTLPAAPDYLAPDGSEVRLLLDHDVGGMAHFQLHSGATSQAVVHATVREFWYFLSGRGEMWRSDAALETIVPVVAGTCIEVPPGTRFQFRAVGPGPLAAVAVTIPRWPGPQEATPVAGKWSSGDGAGAPKVTQALGTRRAFFERFIIDRPKNELVLAIKSAGGASVNVDGPFRFSTYSWSRTRSPPGRHPDEDVLEPTWANVRKDAHESNVHLHIPWSEVGFVRLEYVTLPLIDHNLRIGLFAHRPRDGVRDPELFWFYGFRDGPRKHDLCDAMPAENGTAFSQARAIDELGQ